MSPDELRSTITRLRAFGLTDTRIAAHIPGASAQTVRRWMSQGEIEGRHEAALLALLSDAEKATGLPAAQPGSKPKASPARALPSLEEVVEIVESEGPITTQELALRMNIRVRDAVALLRELLEAGAVQVRTERMWSIKAGRTTESQD